MDDKTIPTDGGRVRFTTITGSHYDIDFDAGVLRRTTGPPVDPEWPSATLRQDGEAVTFMGAIGSFTIGSEVTLTIQLPGNPAITYRRATPIVAFEWIRPRQPPVSEPA